MKRILVVSVAVALFASVGIGIAAASIPSSSGTINGCYNKVTHVLKVVDSSSSCNGLENSLNWNQTGPAGPQGPAGPAGAGGASLDYISGTFTAVIPGDPGTADGRYHTTIDCPEGETPVNLFPQAQPTFTNVNGPGVTGLESFTTGSPPRGYSIFFINNNGTDTTVSFPYQLICARS
jgi:hypothetical protein